MSDQGQKPVLTIERRVYNAIHWHYDEKQKREIWQYLWLAKQAVHYSHRSLVLWVGISVTFVAVAFMWNSYRHFAWIAVMLPGFFYMARRTHRMGEWYRVRLAALMNQKREHYSEVDDRLFDVRQEIGENEPTITIEVEFESENLPNPPL